MTHIHLLHENDEWMAPLRTELDALQLPHREWFLDEGHLDLSDRPPEGLYYSRMSASAHTRGHSLAAKYASTLLEWLERHNCKVINGSSALRLELSKTAQHHALAEHSIATPRTIAAIGKNSILEAARSFRGPMIIKHNRGGKGTGVHLFQDIEELGTHLSGEAFEPPVDGVTLVQQYIKTPEPFITRVEFIGGELLYAVRVDTTGGFELCPADTCKTDQPRFMIHKNFSHPVVQSYRSFLRRHRIQVAAFEFAIDKDGTAYTYDININTNYNPAAERQAQLSGMQTLARFLQTAFKQSREQFAQSLQPS